MWCSVVHWVSHSNYLNASPVDITWNSNYLDVNNHFFKTLTSYVSRFHTMCLLLPMMVCVSPSFVSALSAEERLNSGAALLWIKSRLNTNLMIVTLSTTLWCVFSGPPPAIQVSQCHFKVLVTAWHVTSHIIYCWWTHNGGHWVQQSEHLLCKNLWHRKWKKIEPRF